MVKPLSTLSQELGDALRANKQTLAVAESCTGGLLAKAVTDILGSSAYFMGGVVTYSNASKIKLLGVDVETLERCGAVSEPVALRMAECVRGLLDADIGVGITGVAGPEGGSVEKPVGTVYIAWDIQGALSVRLFQFGDIGRSAVREAAAESAIEGILEAL